MATRLQTGIPIVCSLGLKQADGEHDEAHLVVVDQLAEYLLEHSWRGERNIAEAFAECRKSLRFVCVTTCPSAVRKVNTPEWRLVPRRGSPYDQVGHLARVGNGVLLRDIP